MAMHSRSSSICLTLVTCRVLDLWSEGQEFNPHQGHVEFSQLLHLMAIVGITALEPICNAHCWVATRACSTFVMHTSVSL